MKSRVAVEIAILTFVATTVPRLMELLTVSIYKMLSPHIGAYVNKAIPCRIAFAASIATSIRIDAILICKHFDMKAMGSSFEVIE